MIATAIEEFDKYVRLMDLIRNYEFTYDEVVDYEKRRQKKYFQKKREWLKKNKLKVDIYNFYMELYEKTSNHLFYNLAYERSKIAHTPKRNPGASRKNRF